MNSKAFWDRVKFLIRTKGVTQAATARACGVLPDTFRRWISLGRIPPLTNSYWMARYLGDSLEYLINGREPDKTSVLSREVLDLLNAIIKKMSK